MGVLSVSNLSISKQQQASESTLPAVVSSCRLRQEPEDLGSRWQEIPHRRRCQLRGRYRIRDRVRVGVRVRDRVKVRVRARVRVRVRTRDRVDCKFGRAVDRV